MDRQPRNLGRAYLVKKLQERGLSRRDAVRNLNAIIWEMKKALKRGWEALNFVLHRPLSSSVTRSLALDAHGKCLGFALLGLEL